MTDNTHNIILPDYFPEGLTQRSKYISLEKGERLFLTGDKVMGIYYVIEGELKALRSMMEGTEVVMMRSEAGNYGSSSFRVEFVWKPVPLYPENQR